MHVLTTGIALSDARERLKLTREQLATLLGLSPATLKRHEKAGRLDLCVALAVECLLRRDLARTNAPVSPEERAERKFRERKRLLELKAEAGMVKAAPTVKETVQRRLEARTLTGQMASEQVRTTESARLDAVRKECVERVRILSDRWSRWTLEAGPRPLPEPADWNAKVKQEIMELERDSRLEDYAYEPLSEFLSWVVATREVPQPDDPRYAHLFVYPYVPLRRP